MTEGAESVKNFYTAEDEERFQAAYRVSRAKEILERVRWRQAPPGGELRDKDGNRVDPKELPDGSYWSMYFEGRAPKLGEDDERAVTRVEKLLAAGKPISPIDLYNVEQALCRLNPFYAEEGGELERRALEFVVRTAKEEVEAGLHKNLKAALLSYGLTREAEELRDE